VTKHLALPAALVNVAVNKEREDLHREAYKRLLENPIAAAAGMEMLAARQKKPTPNKHRLNKAEKKALKKARQK